MQIYKDIFFFNFFYKDIFFFILFLTGADMADIMSHGGDAEVIRHI